MYRGSLLWAAPFFSLFQRVLIGETKGKETGSETAKARLSRQNQ